MLRRRIMMQGVGGRLPSEYQEVEWIMRNNYLSYIDTGYICRSYNQKKILYVSDIVPLTSDSACSIVGSQLIDNRTPYIAVSGGVISVGCGKISAGSKSITFSNPTIKTKVLLSTNNGILTTEVNEQIIDTRAIGAKVITGLREWVLGFNISSYPQWQGGCKLYGFELYDGGFIVRNMIPCYLKSNNKTGMYDIVNGVFYTNQGTGEFIVGPNK